MTQIFRIIKKYSNRRLYDTETRCYITLEDVKAIVLKHMPFKVLDAKTGRDVTQAILLQIIHDQESESAPIFTTEILQNLIRFYGHPLQKHMSQLLTQCFNFLSQPTLNTEPEHFQSHLKEWAKKQGASLHTALDIAKHNMTAWQSVFETYSEAENTSTENPKKKP